MKNLKFMLVALMAGILCMGLNACSSDDNEDTYDVYYRAAGGVSSSGSLSGLFIIPGFNTAIKNTLEGQTHVATTNPSEKDAVVIKACDEYYSSVNAAGLEGTVTIAKTVKKLSESGDGNETVLKTYTFRK